MLVNLEIHLCVHQITISVPVMASLNRALLTRLVSDNSISIKYTKNHFLNNRLYSLLLLHEMRNDELQTRRPCKHTRHKYGQHEKLKEGQNTGN